MAVDYFTRFKIIKSLLQWPEACSPISVRKAFLFGEKMSGSIEKVTFTMEFR